MRRLALLATMGLFVTACGDSGAGVVVQVRTDYVPGVEFSAVQAHLIGVSDPIERSAFRGDDYVSGVEVAEFVDVPAGTYELAVSLLDSAGATVTQRTTRVSVRDSVRAVVLFARDGMVECTADDACTPAAACATGRCTDGICLAVADDSLCSADEFCSPASGCVAAPTDAGPADASGMDATPMDGGMDTAVPDSMSTDTGPDASFPPDLVGYWPCETSGTGSIVDVTGNGHDAFCTGSQCPTIVPGRVGSACEFDQTLSQRGRMFDAPDLRPPAFTIAFFFRSDRVGTVFGRPLGGISGSSYFVGLTNSSEPLQVQLRIGRDGLTSSVILTSAFVTSTWHHVAATYEGTTSRLYFDGVRVNQRSTSIAHDANDVWIGADYNSGREEGFYDGTLDELRFYDRALSQAEIAALMAM